MSVRNKHAWHPVHVVHRTGAGILGIGLWVFAVLGFANELPTFSTQGQILGLSSNGALSLISLVAGCVLVSAAAWTGPASSAITAIMGALFLTSGLVHLAILHTAVNILAFGLANVFFSLAAGTILLVLGCYGRVAGGLPPDNPYVLAREQRAAETADPGDKEIVRDDADTEQAHIDAELAMGNGTATASQRALVASEQMRLRKRDQDRARQRLGETPSPNEPPNRDA